MCSNIPGAPAYVVHISQLIKYFRACGSYQDFLNRGLLLTSRSHDLVNRYDNGVSVTVDVTWLTAMIMEYL